MDKEGWIVGLRALRAAGLIALAAGALGVGSVSGCTTSPGTGGPSVPAERDERTDAAELGRLLGRVVDAVAEAGDAGYTVNRVLVGRLALLGPNTLTTTLSTPYSYRIVGGGGPGVENVRLLLRDEDDWVMAADSLPGDVATVEYTPYDDQALRIQVEAGSISGGGSGRPLFFLLLARRGGIEALGGGARRDPFRDLAELLGGGVILTSGALLTRDASIRHIEIDRVTMERPTRLGYFLRSDVTYEIVGGGGPGTEALDLTLYRGDREVIDQDVLPDNFPVLSGVTVPESQEYTIEASLYAVQEGEDPNGEYWFYWILAEH